jgi:N-acetylglucosamine-6-phosphate deacetylase
LNNLLRFTETSVADAIGAITANPARMLRRDKTKGTLQGGADADLVVLSETKDKDGKTVLAVDEVWKFGEKVFSSEKTSAKL